MIAVCGGEQRAAAGIAFRSHRVLYGRAVLAWLDPEDLTLTPGLSWQSPVDDPERVGHRFGAPARDGGTLLLCTERELVRLGPGGLDPRGPESHRWMADVHHSFVHQGQWWAVATGIDGLVSADGDYVGLGARPPERDLRAAVLPRARLHPNYGFSWDGAMWVTCGRTGDVRSSDGRRWPLTDTVIHDGIPTSDGIWFTAVDGRLLRVDPSSGRVDRTVQLRQPSDGPEPLGWCRGLCLRDGRAFVGFTRIRTTRWRGALAWTSGALRGRAVASRRPTRIGVFELASGRRIAEIGTEQVGLHAVFGLI